MNLRVELNPEERSELESLLRQTAAESTQRSLNELLGHWSDFVRAVERGYDDSVYEYTNDLSVRDRLEKLVAAASPTLRQKLESVIAPVDERFAVATEPAARSLSETVGNVASWWRRVPKLRVGELADDLEAMGNVE